MAAKKINKNMKFEEALAELEAAVEKLESGDLPLEEAIEEKLVVSPVNDDNFHTEEFEEPDEEE